MAYAHPTRNRRLSPVNGTTIECGEMRPGERTMQIIHRTMRRETLMQAKSGIGGLLCAVTDAAVIRANRHRSN